MEDAIAEKKVLVWGEFLSYKVFDITYQVALHWIWPRRG